MQIGNHGTHLLNGAALMVQQRTLYGCLARIVREIGTGKLVGVAVEMSIVAGRPTHLVFPEAEDRRPYRFAVGSGKVDGVPWRADRASDEEIAEALAELSGPLNGER